MRTSAKTSAGPAPGRPTACATAAGRAAKGTAARAASATRVAAGSADECCTGCTGGAAVCSATRAAAHLRGTTATAAPKLIEGSTQVTIDAIGANMTATSATGSCTVVFIRAATAATACRYDQ